MVPHPAGYLKDHERMKCSEFHELNVNLLVYLMVSFFLDSSQNLDCLNIFAWIGTSLVLLYKKVFF